MNLTPKEQEILEELTYWNNGVMYIAPAKLAKLLATLVPEKETYDQVLTRLGKSEAAAVFPKSEEKTCDCLKNALRDCYTRELKLICNCACHVPTPPSEEKRTTCDANQYKNCGLTFFDECESCMANKANIRAHSLDVSPTPPDAWEDRRKKLKQYFRQVSADPEVINQMVLHSLSAEARAEKQARTTTLEEVERVVKERMSQAQATDRVSLWLELESLLTRIKEMRSK